MGTSKIRIDATTLGAMNRLFGIIGLLLGLAFLFVGGFWIHHQHLDSFLQLIAKSESAIGQVVANRPVTVYPSPSSRSLSYTAYQAVVRFTDHNGQAITFTDKLGFARPSFSVGHQVRIFYDPRNAQHAMIDRGWKNFVIPGICLIFGGLIVLGSIQRLIGSARSFSEFLLLPPFCLRPLLFLPFQFLLALYETGQTVIDPQIEEAPEKESFAYEEDLRDYLAQSLRILEDGLAPTSKSREPGAFAGFLRAKSPIEVLSGISQNQKAGLWKTWAYCLFSSHSASF